MTDRSVLAEVLALRALLTTWIDASLAHNPDREAYCRAIEEMAQGHVEFGTRFAGATEEEMAFIKTTASNRISEIMTDLGKEA